LAVDWLQGSSEWGLHRGLSQRGQQLRAFVILRKRRGEGSQPVFSHHNLACP